MVVENNIGAKTKEKYFFTPMPNDLQDIEDVIIKASVNPINHDIESPSMPCRTPMLMLMAIIMIVIKDFLNRVRICFVAVKAGVNISSANLNGIARHSSIIGVTELIHLSPKTTGTNSSAVADIPKKTGNIM